MLTERHFYILDHMWITSNTWMEKLNCDILLVKRLQPPFKVIHNVKSCFLFCTSSEKQCSHIFKWFTETANDLEGSSQQKSQPSVTFFMQRCFLKILFNFLRGYAPINCHKWVWHNLQHQKKSTYQYLHIQWYNFLYALILNKKKYKLHSRSVKLGFLKIN